MKSPSVVIVHWNTPDALKKLLVSLRPIGEHQITVVDNASRRSVDWIKEEFPLAQLIQNKKNLGYATACNQGVKKSNGEWIAFLNPDVLISQKQIANLIDVASEKDLDAFSVETTSDYKKPLPTGLSLLAEFTPLKYLIPLSFFSRKTLTGGLLFIKTGVLKQVGGWDERFFLWFEDSDLTKRLYDAGFHLGWIKSNVRHSGGESFRQLDEKKKNSLFFASMNKYAKKHLSGFGKIVARLLQHRYAS